MRILIDSQIYVWAILDDHRLSARARKLLRSDEHELFFSLASLWELGIKIRLGKLRTLTSSIAFLHDSLAENNISVLNVRYKDLLALEYLGHIHRDPFDRILVAQAIANDLKLLTADAIMRRYPVPTIW